MTLSPTTVTVHKEILKNKFLLFGHIGLTLAPKPWYRGNDLHVHDLGMKVFCANMYDKREEDILRSNKCSL